MLQRTDLAAFGFELLVGARSSDQFLRPEGPRRERVSVPTAV